MHIVYVESSILNSTISECVLKISSSQIILIHLYYFKYVLVTLSIEKSLINYIWS